MSGYFLTDNIFSDLPWLLLSLKTYGGDLEQAFTLTNPPNQAMQAVVRCQQRSRLLL